jgi:phytanoyl-CoA hydroxylase
MTAPSERTSLRDLYEDCGVVSVQGLLPAADIRMILDEVDLYIEEVARDLPPDVRFYESDGQTVRSLHWMNAFSEFFAELCADERLMGAVADVVDWEPRPHYVELFAKPATVGSRTPEHQEEPYHFIRPAEFVTLWLALDRVTDENGPVTFFVGSHKMGVLPHRYQDAGGNLLTVRDLDALEALPAMPFELEPGDATMHHPRTVHFSEPNRSGRRRRGLGFLYRSTTSQVDEEGIAALLGTAPPSG